MFRKGNTISQAISISEDQMNNQLNSIKYGLMVFGGLIVTLLLIIVFIMGGGISAFQHVRFRSAIQSVLSKNAKTSSGASSVADVVVRMKAIETSGCPNEFRVAYLSHIKAWETMAVVQQQAIELKNDHSSGGSYVDAFIRGAILDPFGKPNEVRAAGGELGNQAEEANQQMRATFNQVEQVAEAYGASRTALTITKERAQAITCANNMKQIALAFQIWSLEHENKYPFKVPMSQGGTMELCSPSRDGFHQNAAVHFMAMSNELGTAAILVCPADSSKRRAVDWPSLQSINVTYQINVKINVDDDHPSEILAVCPVHGMLALSDGSIHFGQFGSLQASPEMKLYTEPISLDPKPLGSEKKDNEH